MDPLIYTNEKLLNWKAIFRNKTNTKIDEHTEYLVRSGISICSSIGKAFYPQFSERCLFELSMYIFVCIVVINY